MKVGPISKLKITKIGHRPSQFKKVSDALPVFCADKNFQGLNEVLWTGHDLVETDFMPPNGLPLTMYKLALSTQMTKNSPMACVQSNMK